MNITIVHTCLFLFMHVQACTYVHVRTQTYMPTHTNDPPSMLICIITTGSMVWWLMRITLGPGCPVCWLAIPGWGVGVCPCPCCSDWSAGWGWLSAVGLPLADIVTVVPKLTYIQAITIINEMACCIQTICWWFTIHIKVPPDIETFPQ